MSFEFEVVPTPPSGDATVANTPLPSSDKVTTYAGTPPTPQRPTQRHSASVSEAVSPSVMLRSAGPHRITLAGNPKIGGESFRYVYIKDHKVWKTGTTWIVTGCAVVKDHQIRVEIHGLRYNGGASWSGDIWIWLGGKLI